MEDKIAEIKSAMKVKDFTKFGEILETEAVNMHAVMMTSRPPLYYWLPETFKIISTVIVLRSKGFECYFTIDAGPNVHVICREADSGKIKSELEKVTGVKQILANVPAEGAKII
jgi:diphosphomevalonate decarboxylase